MILKHPFFISSRLLPALSINGAVIQVEYNGHYVSGRNAFKWTIDLDGEEYTGHGLSCFGNLQKGFLELVAWLYSAGESYNWSQRVAKNEPDEPLFPLPVVQWAAKNSSELVLMEEELGENEFIKEGVS